MNDVERLNRDIDERLIQFRMSLYRYWRQHPKLEKERLQAILISRIVEAIEMVEYSLQRDGILPWNLDE